MPTTSPSSGHTNTSVSAWSRLVEITQNAAKRPRHDESSIRNHSTPASVSASQPPTAARPAKMRRLTEPSSRLFSTRSPSTFSSRSRDFIPPAQTTMRREHTPCDLGQHHALPAEPAAAETECIEVCPCLEGDPPLPGAKCSYQRPYGHRKMPKASESSSPVHGGIQGSQSPHIQFQDQAQAEQPGTNNTTRPKISEGRAEEHSSAKPRDHFSVTAIGLGHREDKGDVVDNNLRAADAGAKHDGNGDRQDADLGRGTSVDARVKSTMEDTFDTTHPTKVGLQKSSQDTLNRTMSLQSSVSGPPNEEEVIRPSPPSSSQDPTPYRRLPSARDENAVLSTRRVKRRLTLHSSSHDGLASQKRRKASPRTRSTVQTTLNLAIGGSAGMRECKVCDTVYNPFHPEDVKVHAKIHAGVVRKRTAA